MNNKNTIKKLENMAACDDGVQWVTDHGGDMAALWAECKRGDWMAWYVSQNPRTNKTPEFILACADVAEYALKKCSTSHVKQYKAALTACRNFAKGSGNIQVVWDARNVIDSFNHEGYITSLFRELTDVVSIPLHSYDVPANAAGAIIRYNPRAEYSRLQGKFANIFRKYFVVGQRGLTTVKGVNNG